MFLSSKQDMVSNMASQLSPDPGLTRSATSGEAAPGTPTENPTASSLALAQMFLP